MVDMKISRRWFIQSKKERIEDVYRFNPDKDVLLALNLEKNTNFVIKSS